MRAASAQEAPAQTARGRSSEYAWFEGRWSADAGRRPSSSVGYRSMRPM
ncbi:hypothetical protein ACFPRL_23175 [Pseudoclavibacter helvolus]